MKIDRVIETVRRHKLDEMMTMASKHIGPLVGLDSQPVGDGLVGEVWEKAMPFYEAVKSVF